MPAKDSYFESKREHLLALKGLVQEEHRAIMSSDLTALDHIMKKVEREQGDLENLIMLAAKLTEQQKGDISKLEQEIARLQKENIELLMGKREAVLRELKVMRTRKDASKAYTVVQERRALLSESR